MPKHLWFFNWPGHGAHGYGHYQHDLIMDEIELGSRINEYIDRCILDFQPWT